MEFIFAGININDNKIYMVRDSVSSTDLWITVFEYQLFLGITQYSLDAVGFGVKCRMAQMPKISFHPPTYLIMTSLKVLS